MSIPIIGQVVSDWNSVYKHNGGAGALVRSAVGTAKVILSPGSDNTDTAEIEALTFSVVPNLTAMWSLLVSHALSGMKHRIIVGDCSGGYRSKRGSKETVYAVYNFLHGRKLDYFIRNVCRAEYVLISDDDIMWVSDEPVRYALGVLNANPKCAVVSLKPRSELSSVMRERVDIAMGSFCLVIRRSVWLKERLSFRIARPPREGKYDWFYDTADKANIRLIELGYDIDIAPESIRNTLVTIEGASTWTLKIHKHNGNIAPLIENIPVRQEKALRVLLFLDAVGKLLAAYYGDDSFVRIIKKDAYTIALNACKTHLEGHTIQQITYEVNNQALILEKQLTGIKLTNRM